MQNQTPQDASKAALLDVVRDRLSDGTFVKATLGKYRGNGPEARCTVSRVVIKSSEHLQFVTRCGTQETAQNFALEAALAHLAGLICGDYFSVTVFSTLEDVSLVYSNKRVPALARRKPAMTEAPLTEHNRAKAYLVDTAAPYLAQLGVTQTRKPGEPPEVKPSMYGKFRQICRFVEIIDGLTEASIFAGAAAVRIVDIGSGKGYLTFALHEHLRECLKLPVQTLGLEANAGLAAQCNAVTRHCGISGLSFEAIRAEDWAARETGRALDILIALHACDTATDDAIHLGITANAAMIVCAPCCQHEIAPQLDPAGSPMQGLLKFGLLKQRQADLITDAARALLLEAAGYSVRIIEFVAPEHSAKNLLIAAVKSAGVNRAAAHAQYADLARFAGFKQQRLGQLLAVNSGHVKNST